MLFVRRLALVALSLVLAYSAVALAAPGDAPIEEPVGSLVVRTSGDSVAAEFVAATTTTLSFKTDKGALELPAGEFVRWGFPIESSRAALVLARDGSQFVGEVFEVKDNQILLLASDCDDISLDIRKAVQAIVIQQPPVGPIRDKLLRRLSPAKHDAARAGERLLLANGDELTGTLVGILNDKVAWKGDVGPIEIELAKVTAIVLSSEPLATPRQGLLVGLSDGSMLVADKFVAGAGKASLVASGIDIRADVAKIVYLQTLGDSIVYLSDLPELEYKHIPYLTIAWPFERDRNASGNRLRAADKWRPKGIGMHAAARLTYRLDEAFDRFETSLAIDDAAIGQDAPSEGSVIFKVFALLDNKWQSIYTSSIVRGGEAPIPVSLDIRNAKGLSLMVDVADWGDQRDYADWLDARLIKSPAK